MMNKYQTAYQNVQVELPVDNKDIVVLRELVEKSILKQVELYQRQPDTVYNVICPNCGKVLFMLTDLDYEFGKEDSYCRHCGQAIKKWSDGND